LLTQLLAAGTNERCSLAACAERYLAQVLDKAEQHSDWSGELTREQLDYAAQDAEVLLPLYQALAAKIREADLEEAAQIEERCLPALVWMAQHGVAFDNAAWLALARAAEQEAVRHAAELDAQAPRRPGALEFESWNWDSPQQVLQALKLAG